MKTSLLAIIAMLMAGTDVQAQSPEGKKILVVYFSHSGNTRLLAEQIGEFTGGELFEIQPVDAYSGEYQAVVDQAKKEINAGYKPALKARLENIGDYDVIFVGSPNWWSTIAPPVTTFLSGYDLKGKTIVPFMTHEGSRMGRSVSEIKKLCPGSTVLDGFPVRGSEVKKSQGNVMKWLREIKMAK